MAQVPDFFISYTSADRAWAEWIAWQLEAEGYEDLGRGEGEDQPAAARIDRPGPEDLGQGRPGGVGVVAVEDGVGAVDHDPILRVTGPRRSGSWLRSSGAPTT
jgi:hypothetical protein